MLFVLTYIQVKSCLQLVNIIYVSPTKGSVRKRQTDMHEKYGRPRSAFLPHVLMKKKQKQKVNRKQKIPVK